MKRRFTLRIFVIFFGVVILLTSSSCGKKSSDKAAEPETSTTSLGTQITPSTTTDPMDGLKINDPDGKFALFSDRAITKYPIKGRVIGNGQILTFEYDNSKGVGLKYELFYVKPNGDVISFETGDLESKPNNIYSKSIRMENVDAADRPGFVKISTVDFANIVGENGKTNPDATIGLGTYFINYELAK